MREQLDRVELSEGILFFYLNSRLALASLSENDLQKWNEFEREQKSTLLQLVEAEFDRPFHEQTRERPGRDNPKWSYEVNTFILQPLSVVGKLQMGDWWQPHKQAEEYLPRHGYKLIKP